MQGVREFRLILCADVLGFAVDDSVETLEWIVEQVEEFGCLPCRPLIISERRLHRLRNIVGRLETRSRVGLGRVSSAL